MEKQEKPKNLVYKNPLDFKEKKKNKKKWEEYRFGEWRKGSGKTYVTLETEIPKLEDSKALQAPDEAAFHKKQVEIEDKIKAIYELFNTRKTKFSELYAQKDAQKKGFAMNPEMKVKMDRLN